MLSAAHSHPEAHLGSGAHGGPLTPPAGSLPLRAGQLHPVLLQEGLGLAASAQP